MYFSFRANPEEFDPTTWETNNYKIFDPANIPAGTIDIPTWAQVRKIQCNSYDRRLLIPKKIKSLDNLYAKKLITTFRHKIFTEINCYCNLNKVCEFIFIRKSCYS